MDINQFKQSLRTLFTEAVDGPPNPKETWFTSNEAGSGMLGTISKLTSEQASKKPNGAAHSIAEHAAHIAFSFRTGLQYASGDFSPVDWSKSWETGKLDQARWSAIQNEIRANWQKLLQFMDEKESFTDINSITGFCGTIAHTAYHLGAIRTMLPMFR